MSTNLFYKKVISFCVFVLIVSNSFSQKMEQGDFLFDLGVGIGSYSSYNNVGFKPNILKNPGLTHLSVNYCFSNNLSVGLNVKVGGSKGEETTDSTFSSTKADVGHYYLNIDYYFLNKEKFSLFGGLGFGLLLGNCFSSSDFLELHGPG